MGIFKPSSVKERMASLSTSIIIQARCDGFQCEILDFWDNEDIQVSGFSTGIDNRDGVQCVIANCGCKIPSGLDNCHIIPPNDPDTVRIPVVFFHSSLTCLTSGKCCKT